MLPEWWDTENTYYLSGVIPGVRKRAADADVLWRNHFTLDFDVRKELEKELGSPISKGTFDSSVEAILSALDQKGELDKARYVVNSGNGIHVHYFGEATKVVKEEWVAGMKSVFEYFAGICPIPPDFGCGNAGRIMRLPGSWNVKQKPKLPVDFIVWNPKATFCDMEEIQKEGQERIAEEKKRTEAARAEFRTKNPEGGSDTIDTINRIPIEQVVFQLLNCRISQHKKDGGMRFVDEHGKERGFFKHQQHNTIIHEGTGLFPPPNGVGYNCLGLVKAVLNVDAATAIRWFAERSPDVREAVQKEREVWVENHTSHEIQFFDHFVSQPDCGT